MDNLNDGWTVIADRKTLTKLAKLINKDDAQKKKKKKAPSKDELSL